MKGVKKSTLKFGAKKGGVDDFIEAELNNIKGGGGAP